MKVELKIPAVGESISEVTLSKWLKKDGDYVKMDEAIAEIETEKATVELNATHDGTLAIALPEGSEALIGAIAAFIDTSAQAPLSENTNTPEKVENVIKPAEVSPVQNYAHGVPSPSAKKILAEKGIDPLTLEGKGKNGRITKADALEASPAIGSGIVPTETTHALGLRNQRREKMSNLRQTVSVRLVAAKNETAMLTTFNEVNMEPIMQIRNLYKDKFKEQHGIGLGFMSFFTRASILALQKYPAVNAYIDGREMIFNDYCDIAIAVSGPKGLMVPVMRNAESLTLWDIEKKVAELAEKARNNKLTIDEMTGGTFTISNGGVFGSMLSTPILNPPQSAILGMHNIIQRPIAENGQVVIKPMMYLALSYDHRIIDGRESVGFLLSIKQALENPNTLLNGADPIKSLLGI